MSNNGTIWPVSIFNSSCSSSNNNQVSCSLNSKSDSDYFNQYDDSDDIEYAYGEGSSNDSLGC